MITPKLMYNSLLFMNAYCVAINIMTIRLIMCLIIAGFQENNFFKIFKLH